MSQDDSTIEGITLPHSGSYTSATFSDPRIDKLNARIDEVVQTLGQHINDLNNPHATGKIQIGLSKVDNHCYTEQIGYLRGQVKMLRRVALTLFLLTGAAIGTAVFAVTNLPGL